ncbi:hypothetical protein ABID58_005439 [Bradyrhizobium sp. S3.2.6]|uniref:hypothetical protein n=1 Tax=Bradyrhizobium sp. S3.2.6 TaxID=3156428 RepID=UPI003396F0E1
MKVTVYRFTQFDAQTDMRVTSRRWATRDAIELVGGTVLENTAIEIDPSHLTGGVEGMTSADFDPRR